MGNDHRTEREQGKAVTEDRRPKTDDVGLFARANAVVRRIIGAPDYSAYLRHMAEKHHGCAVLSELEFLDEQLTARYSTPGARCC